MSSVVPYPWDTSGQYLITEQYRQDANALNVSIGFSSFEGYIDAYFAYEVLTLFSPGTNYTGSGFITTLYDLEIFTFYGLRFGAFGNAQCTSNEYALTSPSIPLESAHGFSLPLLAGPQIGM